MRRVERALSETYERDTADELELQDRCAAFLGLVICSVPEASINLEVDRAGVPRGDEEEIRKLKLCALQFIAIRALRSARAARAVLAVGYEPEARTHDRVLAELISHRSAVVADPSGKAALDWLKGKAGKGITAKVNAMQPEDLYRSLSQDSHGDPHPVLRMMAEQEAGGERPLTIGPARSVAARASLLMHAGFMRDQAVAIAHFAGLELSGVENIDAAIREGWRRLDDEADETRSASTAAKE